MHSAVSGALVIEKETTHKDKTMKQQFPVYFISEVLVGSKRFYSEVETFFMQSL
jgi:DNA polymerase II small subunit/DNA polymerase delta subunit B